MEGRGNWKPINKGSGAAAGAVGPTDEVGKSFGACGMQETGEVRKRSKLKTSIMLNRHS